MKPLITMIGYAFVRCKQNIGFPLFWLLNYKLCWIV